MNTRCTNVRHVAAIDYMYGAPKIIGIFQKQWNISIIIKIQWNTLIINGILEIQLNKLTNYPFGAIYYVLYMASVMMTDASVSR